jgi:hypothetical protein
MTTLAQQPAELNIRATIANPTFDNMDVPQRRTGSVRLSAPHGVDTRIGMTCTASSLS